VAGTSLTSIASRRRTQPYSSLGICERPDWRSSFVIAIDSWTHSASFSSERRRAEPVVPANPVGAASFAGVVIVISSASRRVGCTWC
jgi:hypothetical protein